MVNYIKYGTVALVLLAAFVLMPMFYMKWRQAENTTTQIVTYSKAKDDTIAYYTNKYHQEVASKEAVMMDYRSFKKISDDRHLDYLRQFDGVKASLKNVSVATQVTGQVNIDSTGSLKPMIVNDVKVLRKTFGDRFYSEEVTVFGDSVSTKIHMEVPIEGVMFWKRKKILGLRIGKKEWRSEFKSPNPHIHITQAEQVVVRPD